jgi:hypothetical protein
MMLSGKMDRGRAAVNQVVQNRLQGGSIFRRKMFVAHHGDGDQALIIGPGMIRREITEFQRTGNDAADPGAVGLFGSDISAIAAVTQNSGINCMVPQTIGICSRLS